MKYIKRISFGTWFMFIIVIIGEALHITRHIDFYLSTTILECICIIMTIYYLYHDIRYNISIYKLYGVITADKVFHVTYNSFIDYTGRAPLDSDKSMCYEKLYSIHDLPITNRIIKKCKNHNFLKLKTNGFEIISWSKQKEKAILLGELI